MNIESCHWMVLYVDALLWPRRVLRVHDSTSGALISKMSILMKRSKGKPILAQEMQKALTRGISGHIALNCGLNSGRWIELKKEGRTLEEGLLPLTYPCETLHVPSSASFGHPHWDNFLSQITIDNGMAQIKSRPKKTKHHKQALNYSRSERNMATLYSDVVVIGAWFSRINFACLLQRKLGFTDYVIYDRALRFGGTWAANRCK